MELTVHAGIEEQIFYPAVKQSAGKKNKEEYDLVLESVEEHALVKHVIKDLEAIDGSDETYKPKLKVLKEIVEEHVKEEERELFPGVRDLLDDDELLELGRRMEELKTQLQQQTAA
jgi:hemerythrin superfamily protein